MEKGPSHTQIHHLKMPYPNDSLPGTRVDMFIYIIAAVSYITTELAAVEGIMKIISLTLSIAGFGFTFLNQFGIWLKNRKAKQLENQKNKEDAEKTVSKGRKSIK